MGVHPGILTILLSLSSSPLDRQFHRLFSRKHIGHGQAPSPDHPPVHGPHAPCPVTLPERRASRHRQSGQLAAIDPSTTKGVVDRLKQRGLIEVASSPKDRRKTIISISAKGAELVEDMVEPGHRVTEDIMAPLNPAERVALVYLLSKIS